MGAFYSYFYYSSVVAETNKNKEDTDDPDLEQEEPKGSDPSYTILYPPHEEEFHKKAAAEARERELLAEQQHIQRKSKNGRVDDEVWVAMSKEYFSFVSFSSLLKC